MAYDPLDVERLRSKKTADASASGSSSASGDPKAKQGLPFGGKRTGPLPDRLQTGTAEDIENYVHVLADDAGIPGDRCADAVREFFAFVAAHHKAGTKDANDFTTAEALQWLEAWKFAEIDPSESVSQSTDPMLDGREPPKKLAWTLARNVAAGPRTPPDAD